jgi:hypothetical protein
MCCVVSVIKNNGEVWIKKMDVMIHGIEKEADSFDADALLMGIPKVFA